MLRIPVCRKSFAQTRVFTRLHSYSSNYIRSTFIEYFKGSHGHKFIRSSPVVPLCDPTVPFVNAGMNQFKGVFQGQVQAPYPRVVNSQKCVRVGGKHNDLDVVGTDGHHHTFFEMLGNWSFGDYYKKEACQMAWDLLLGPYRLKPENLVVTYFAGDVIIGLTEDQECRDIWKSIGVQSDRLRALGAKDNFWEMGATGPCGPCTEIHHVNSDGSLTEIWNIVFIQCNREADGSVKNLRARHVDTGLGLERLSALLQGARSNYDTDLFAPILSAIHQHSGVSKYSGRMGPGSSLDCAYRRLADHARMAAVCLADGAFPASSLNLKQILRRSFKISIDTFQCKSGMLQHLYDVVSEILGPTYPELLARSKDAKLIIEQEEAAYAKLRSGLKKKWRDLAKAYPEVEELCDVELPGFALGYKELKEIMAKQKSNIIPGEVVFKLYDTHGFQEDIIERIAKLNHFDIDKKKFSELLSQHKARHKTAFKEQADKKGLMFDKAIEKLHDSGTMRTNDQFKYDYTVEGNKLDFEPLKTKLEAILNEDGEWIDYSEPCENRPYYLVTKDTNFFCEEGGQTADSGKICFRENLVFYVETVFKIRDFVFHKGYFKLLDTSDNVYINLNSEVTLNIDGEKRLKTMRNHTATHLLNAAVRKVLSNSAVCQIGSKVSEKGLVLNLSVYGEKLTQDAVLEAQKLVRQLIQSNTPVVTSVLDNVQLSTQDGVVTVPGETYPETGLRLVQAGTEELFSKELCCGTHVPSTGHVLELCVVLMKGAAGNTPALHALTGNAATQARELFCRAQKLNQVIELVDTQRMKSEVSSIKEQLATLCGTAGAPYGDYAACLALLDSMQKKTTDNNDLSLLSIAEAEVEQLSAQGGSFLVHFLRCSYLAGGPLPRAVLSRARQPAMLFGCANGVVHVVCSVPESEVTAEWNASSWLATVLPVFGATATPSTGPNTVAEMTGTKVSLITCEQLVGEAMRAASSYAAEHARRHAPLPDDSDDRQDRRSN